MPLPDEKEVDWWFFHSRLEIALGFAVEVRKTKTRMSPALLRMRNVRQVWK